MMGLSARIRNLAKETRRAFFRITRRTLIAYKTLMSKENATFPVNFIRATATIFAPLLVVVV